MLAGTEKPASGGVNRKIITNSDQITFLNNIIGHLTKNGTIDKTLLFEPPFTDIHDQGILGIFDDTLATKVISIIDEINGNAEVG